MTKSSRLATKDWNELNDKEWNAEFEKSRHLVVSEIIDLFERRPDLGLAFEMDAQDITARPHEEGVRNLEIVWNKDGGNVVEAHSNRPVHFSFSRQHRSRYASYKPYNGIVIKVMANWSLRRGQDFRDQKYGLRKDGTHNLKAIGERIERILDAAVYDFESGLRHEAWKADFEQRLNAAHPEFEWEDGITKVGRDYFAPTLEIEAQSDFEEEGLNIELKLNGLTMDEVQPLIALVEKYAKNDDTD